MDYIRDLLGQLEPAEPIETHLAPSYRLDPEVKAVVFDIYGTLLISSSGDIEQAEITTSNLQAALDAAHIAIVGASCENTLQEILNDFAYTIDVWHTAARNMHRSYPEIDILTVWNKVLLHARQRHLVRFDDHVNVMRMTCVFEFLSNKIYPMPGLKACIGDLERKGRPRGIVSNAQFYTPVVMNYFLNDRFEVSDKIGRFDEELTVFSYKLGRGKPDDALFRELVPVLQRKYGLEPGQVLFVGNDMLKDVWTSAGVGFRTALFAGDKRSLRLREDDPRVQGVQPDHIITRLDQLKEIVK